MNRSAVKAHADAYWFRPCRDGKVWLKSRPLDVGGELRRRGLNGSEWSAVFLNYDADRYVDGLYFVRNSLVAGLPAAHFDARALPASDCIQVQDWAGLNDCAHFVSECLTAGGVPVWELGVGNLVHKLRARGDTETLGYFIDLDSAQRIVAAGILDVGDIIAFGTTHKTFAHGHSTIFMGGGKVSNHTHLNHPLFTGGGVFGSGNWRWYASPRTGHPLVILIHFADGDRARSPAAVGWWKMTWRSASYYYYLARTGHAYWTASAPVSLGQGPQAFEGKGYWFDLGAELKIAWTMTGSLEEHQRAGGTLTGTLNGAESIVGTKMS